MNSILKKHAGATKDSPEAGIQDLDNKRYEVLSILMGSEGVAGLTGPGETLHTWFGERGYAGAAELDDLLLCIHELDG